MCGFCWKFGMELILSCDLKEGIRSDVKIIVVYIYIVMCEVGNEVV